MGQKHSHGLPTMSSPQGLSVRWEKRVRWISRVLWCPMAQQVLSEIDIPNLRNEPFPGDAQGELHDRRSLGMPPQVHGRHVCSSQEKIFQEVQDSKDVLPDRRSGSPSREVRLPESVIPCELDDLLCDVVAGVLRGCHVFFLCLGASLCGRSRFFRNMP